MEGYAYRSGPSMPARAATVHPMGGSNMTPHNSHYMEAGMTGPQYSGYWLGGPTSQAQMAQYAQMKSPLYGAMPKGAPGQYTFPAQQQYNTADCYRQYVLPNERPNSTSQNASYVSPAGPAGGHPFQRQYGYPADGAYASPKTGHYFYPPGQPYYLPPEECYGYPAAGPSNRWSRWAYGTPFSASFDSSINGSRHLISLASNGRREMYPPAVIPRQSRQGMPTVTSVQRVSQTRVTDGLPIVNHQLTYVMEGNTAYLYKSKTAADEVRPGSPSPASSRRRARARQRASSRRAQRNGPLRDVAQKKLQPKETQQDKPPEPQTDVTENVRPEKAAEEPATQRPPSETTAQINEKPPDEPSVTTTNGSSTKSDGSQEKQVEKPMEESPKEPSSESAITKAVKSPEDEQVDSSENSLKKTREEQSLKVTEYSNEPSANTLSEEASKNQPKETKKQESKIDISAPETKEDAFQHTLEGQTRKGPKKSRIVRGARLQHKYIPWWVYFALDNFPLVFRSVVDYYFDKMHWPRLEDQPISFQEECVTHGISRDLRQTNRGFAPAWMFVLRRLCNERIVDQFLFPHLLGIFFENGDFPSMDTLPLPAREMCNELDLAEDDFYAVDI